MKAEAQLFCIFTLHFSTLSLIKNPASVLFFLVVGHFQTLCQLFLTEITPLVSDHPVHPFYLPQETDFRVGPNTIQIDCPGQHLTMTNLWSIPLMHWLDSSVSCSKMMWPRALETWPIHILKIWRQSVNNL